MNKENFVFKCPDCLSKAIVVPTGKATVCEDFVTVEVWKDNKIENINVDISDTYPAVVSGGKLADEYALHICAATESEEKGVFYLKSLGFETDENGTYTGLNKTHPELLDETEVTSENMFFIKSDVNPVSPVRRVDRYYQKAVNKIRVPIKSFFLGDFSFGKYDFDITNWAGVRKRFDAGKSAFLIDCSRILVKYNFSDGISEWVAYDSKALELVDDIAFKKLSYIVSNNPKNGPEDESCMKGEDLVFLFGEVNVPEEKIVNLALGERCEVEADAALYETLRFRVKIIGEVSEEDASLTYERKDGAVGVRNFKLYSAGVDAEGYHVFDIKMREFQSWQNTLCALKITLPEGDYELDYVKLAPTGNSSDVKLGKALPMFSDGNFKKGFSVRGMEGDLVPSDDYFATSVGADKVREEYEKAARNDDSNPDKLYADWRCGPLYTYDYINSCPIIKEAGLTYDSKASERIAAIRENNPDVYEKCYLDYEMADDGNPTPEGYFRLADKAGAKELIYKPNQLYTTTDGVKRTGTVLEMTLNGKKMFKGKPYSKFDKNNNSDGTWRFWPHLLISQDQGLKCVDYEKEIQYSTGADRLYCEFDIRLKEYNEEYTRKVHADGIERDNGHMSFLLYSYLRPKKEPKTLLWFGLGLASDNFYYTQYSDVTWCRDSGANTYMYTLAPEAVYNGFDNSIHSVIQKGRKSEDYTKGTKISSDWIHIKVDLTHHIGIILDRVNSEDAYGLGITTRDDWFFDGVNLGFETSDNVDCTFEVANFNFYSYNIEE